MEEKIRERVERAISEKVFPGGVVGYITGEERQIIPVGRYTYEKTSSVVSEGSVYDVASLTKAIPVSTLALKLLDEGKLELDSQVVSYVPEMKTNYNDDLTLWHLLTQTIPFETPLSSLKTKSAGEILQHIFTTQFKEKPGKKVSYSNATSILLGLVVERVTGKKLDILADEVFFTPLGMQSTTFHPQKFPKAKIVPTEIDEWRGMVQGTVHDESSSVLRELMIPGSAGLFSTVSDLMKFLQMLLQKGEYEGVRYFSEKIISAMGENQLPGNREYTGLGWELYQQRFMGNYGTEHTFGKTGFTGCVIMGDVPRRKGLVILSNYHFPTRKRDTSALNSVRCDIADMVFMND